MMFKMMKSVTLFALLVCITVFGSRIAQADTQKYLFDKAHTSVLFYVSHLGFSTSIGRFLDFDGAIMFDRDKPEQSSVDVVIDVTSLDMGGHEKWKAHMLNEDFFDVETYPTITFKSSKIEVTSENTANIHGNLTILGVTKPVVLDTVFNKAGMHPYSGKPTAGFSATATVNRSEFGMDYGIPGVGDLVEIGIEVEANAEIKEIE